MEDLINLHEAMLQKQEELTALSVIWARLENCLLHVGLRCGKRKVHLLAHSGANISLLKSWRLLGTVEFEPRDRVRVKSVEGSIIETHGSIETNILERFLQIPFHFQLVRK